MGDVDKIEALAKAASEGPWYAGPLRESDYGDFVSIGPFDLEEKYGHLDNCVDHYEDTIASVSDENHDAVKNAAFIAGVNPSVALELVKEIRDLRKATQVQPDNEEHVQAILKVYTRLINETPALLSLLYDVDMLPEQTVTIQGAIRVAGVCEAYKLGLAARG